MFFKLTEKYIQDCYDTLMNTDHKDIQKSLLQLKDYINTEDGQKSFNLFFRNYLSYLMLNDISEEEAITLLLQALKDYTNKVKSLNKSICLHVSLKDFPMIYRDIEIPYCMSLGDMVYAILSAFHSNGTHLYMVKFKKENYYCFADPYVDGEIADLHYLCDMKLRKNSQLTVWYDFGCDYYFDVKVMEIKTNNNIFNPQDMTILDGNGYGIWEDGHDLLSLYLSNPESFYEYIEDAGYDEAYFPIHEEFDKEESCQFFYENYQLIKAGYMPLDEEEEV